MSIHASGEDYLEAVLVLEKEKGMVRSVDVARHMEVSKPSVSHAVTTLKAPAWPVSWKCSESRSMWRKAS